MNKFISVTQRRHGCSKFAALGAMTYWDIAFDSVSATPFIVWAYFHPNIANISVFGLLAQISAAVSTKVTHNRLSNRIDGRHA
jgi:uncharacterized protein (DUF427 family)